MIHVFRDAEAVADAAARYVARAAGESIAARGTFRVALSGGSTPERLYRLLAHKPWSTRIEWPAVVALFADERAVAPDHRDRTLRMVREALFDPLGARAPAVRPMRGEAEDLEAAAGEYESELVTPLDLLVMGIGPDGHTASLFPARAAALEMRRRCVAVLDSPKPPPRRLTLTPRALLEAREAIVLVTGSDKATALAAAHDAAATPERCPASLLHDREWLVDVAAAAVLPEDRRGR